MASSRPGTWGIESPHTESSQHALRFAHLLLFRVADHSWLFFQCNCLRCSAEAARGSVEGLAGTFDSVCGCHERQVLPLVDSIGVSDKGCNNVVDPHVPVPSNWFPSCHGKATISSCQLHIESVRHCTSGGLASRLVAT